MMMFKQLSKTNIIIVAVMAASLVLLVVVPQAGKYLVSAQANVTSSDCEVKVTILNNRSKLLEKYKQSETKKYKLVRDKWSNRVAYASRWVEGDAAKARNSLYNYDKLHENLEKEIDKQIGDYKYLEENPLDCTDSKKAELEDKLKQVAGREGKKVIGGQAMIEQLKNAETKHAQVDFKQTTTEMVDNLHKAKQKHPSPKKDAFEVQKY